MTSEEAISRIEGHIRRHRIGEYPHIKIGEALDMAIAALRAQLTTNCHQLEPVTNRHGLTGWISVKTEKPKRRGHYFIAYKFAGSDMLFYGESMWHDDIPDNGYVKGDHFSNEGVNGMYVTHWMHIPKLPEVKA